MIKDYVNPTNDEIAKYQELLSTILMLSKVTQTELGNYLGITRSQVSNISNGHSKMTKAQYIAINVILETVIGEKYKKILKMASEYKEL